MHVLMAEKANAILLRYNISSFPISIETIEYIIEKENIHLEYTKYLKKALYLEENKKRYIYVGFEKNMDKLREYLVHEYGHTYHCGNFYFLNKIVIAKNEAQAKAFCAYFLMPIGIFEQYWKQDDNDYFLSESFGVVISLVRFRKQLSISLIESGEYERLRYDLMLQQGGLCYERPYKEERFHMDNSLLR